MIGCPSGDDPQQIDEPPTSIFVVEPSRLSRKNSRVTQSLRSRLCEGDLESLERVMHFCERWS